MPLILQLIMGLGGSLGGRAAATRFLAPLLGRAAAAGARKLAPGVGRKALTGAARFRRPAAGAVGDIAGFTAGSQLSGSDVPVSQDIAFGVGGEAARGLLRPRTGLGGIGAFFAGGTLASAAFTPGEVHEPPGPTEGAAFDPSAEVNPFGRSDRESLDELLASMSSQSPQQMNEQEFMDLIVGMNSQQQATFAV